MAKIHAAKTRNYRLTALAGHVPFWHSWESSSGIGRLMGRGRPHRQPPSQRRRDAHAIGDKFVSMGERITTLQQRLLRPLGFVACTAFLLLTDTAIPYASDTLPQVGKRTFEFLTEEGSSLVLGQPFDPEVNAQLIEVFDEIRPPNLPERALARWSRDVSVSIEDYRSTNTEESYDLLGALVDELNAKLEIDVAISVTENASNADIRIIIFYSIRSQCDACRVGHSIQVTPIPKEPGVNYFEEMVWKSTDEGIRYLGPAPKSHLFKIGFVHILSEFYPKPANFLSDFILSGQLFTPSNSQHANIEGFFVSSSDGSIRRAFCFAHAKLSENGKRWAFSECLIRALGLPNVVEDCRGGIIGPRIRGQSLSQFLGPEPCDIAAVKTQYRATD